MSTIHKAEPCGCGHRLCQDWHVTPNAAVRGVTFSRIEAEAVAAILNQLKDVRVLEAEGLRCTEISLTLSLPAGAQ